MHVKPFLLEQMQWGADWIWQCLIYIYMLIYNIFQNLRGLIWRSASYPSVSKVPGTRWSLSPWIQYSDLGSSYKAPGLRLQAWSIPSLQSPGGSINYGKAPWRKERSKKWKTSRYRVFLWTAFSFQAPRHTSSPLNTPVHIHTCTHCYGARASASAPCLRAGSHLSFPASSPVGRYTYHSNHFFICIFLLKKGPRWARYYSLSISSVNFKSPLCPLCSPRTDAASSHTSLPHRQLMKLHS